MPHAGPHPDGAEDWRALIEERLAELEIEDARGRDDQAIVTLDQQAVGRLSRQDSLMRQSMAQATQTRRDARRRALHAALERLEAGTFGECEDCGDPIPRGRLALDPSATRCVSCASG